MHFLIIYYNFCIIFLFSVYPATNTITLLKDLNVGIAIELFSEL